MWATVRGCLNHRAPNPPKWSQDHVKDLGDAYQSLRASSAISLAILTHVGRFPARCAPHATRWPEDGAKEVLCADHILPEGRLQHSRTGPADRDPKTEDPRPEDPRHEDLRPEDPRHRVSLQRIGAAGPDQRTATRRLKTRD